MNICDFISEIGRESEFVIYNNRIQTSNEYKKEYLERLIKIEELVFVKDNDYGYHSVSTIFNNIELAKLEIRTTNKEDAVINCFNNILRALGTDVIEDKTKSHDIYDKNYRHEISIIKGTKLYNLINKEEYRVNSIHSMIAPKENVEKYAKISAVSYDDLVECFELDNKKFIMGIKWHPELMLEDEFPNKLFNEFISKCNN